MLDANLIIKRCKQLIANPPVVDEKGALVLIALQKYMDYAIKFIDQIDRRLLQNEKIPSEEKVYSIFEPHTEWITKGKQNKRVELGHMLLITTDQNQFIVDYKVMENEKDPAQIESLKKRLKQKFGKDAIASLSFDKGFWSKKNYESLAAENIPQIVLPKRGKKNIAEKAREAETIFKTLRKKHSAVESNINMLEHHGLGKCVDKGIDGFKRNVGLSVAAYNLHILGNKLQKIDAEKEKKAAKRKMYKTKVA